MPAPAAAAVAVVGGPVGIGIAVATILIGGIGCAVYKKFYYKPDVFPDVMKKKKTLIIGTKGSGKTTLENYLYYGKLPEKEPEPTTEKKTRKNKKTIVYDMRGFDGDTKSAANYCKGESEMIEECDIILYVFKNNEFNPRIEDVFKSWAKYDFNNDGNDDKCKGKILVAVGTYEDEVEVSNCTPMKDNVRNYLNHLEGRCKYGLVSGALKLEEQASTLKNDLVNKLERLTQEEI